MKEKIQATAEKISPYIHYTPVMTSSLLNDKYGCQIFFKCENFQRMGAFKMRGAVNAILNLSKEKLDLGVVTHSSGNFAQALALAAKSLDTKAYIVMPSNAPQVKIDAVKGYGGEIILCKPTLKDRIESADNVSKETGATFIHPSNNEDVILGQATAAFELLQEYPSLDTIIAPVGGGGLIAGTALSVKHFGSNCNVIGAEPFEVDDAYRSLESGKIESNTSTNTIADGLKTQLGDINFPIIQKYVSEIIRVEEDEILFALKLILERMKIIIEPSSATAFAALIKSNEQFKNKKVGIILSGGNLDFSLL